MQTQQRQGDALPTIPYAVQIACPERELGMRRHVYPRLVRSGRMTQETADLEMACMKAALATIERVSIGYIKRQAVWELYYAIPRDGPIPEPLASRVRDFIADMCGRVA